ncbi:MAG TPA: 4-hydroxythreonine-4-phosphate dehydrogenase PdxA [Candidatus Aminicenantes bacterium]|nr:4-hydroxythreonine-4-phosphate dehydrogenase PdxA [Candidatus Aminicenantes bacterium]
MTSPLTFLSTGDPGGIGPEISAKALLRFPATLPYLVGPKRVLHRSMERWAPSLLSQSERILRFALEDERELFTPSPESGDCSFLSFRRALELAEAHPGSTVVTAPISKELWLKAGHPWKGHTEYLESRYGTSPIMFFWGPRFKVALFTHHIPLKSLWKMVTPERLLPFFRLLHNELNVRYRLGFRFYCGSINPHSGENGTLGEEEENLLKPVVSRLREEGIPLEPPAPNDTLFYRLRNDPKAVIVSFSHDLGLTPFKLLYFDKGVNLSLGLPVVRTSPDHGTAFDLAGKGVASEGSLVRALRLARSLQRRRALG